MSSYKGKPVIVDFTADAAYDRLSNISALQGLIDRMPQEVKEKMGDVSFSDDAIVIGTPQVGNIELGIAERVKPTTIKYAAKNSPVPISLTINIEPAGADKASVGAAIDADIPAMLRPFIGGKLQEAADKFGEVLSMILKL